MMMQTALMKVTGDEGHDYTQCVRDELTAVRSLADLIEEKLGAKRQACTCTAGEAGR
jgi:hypothetical protein